jgi:hypothetical protein
MRPRFRAAVTDPGGVGAPLALCCWLGIAIVSVTLFWGATDSPSFRDCLHDRKNSRPYQAIHNENTPFITSSSLRTKLTLACGFVAANENNGALTALAGIIVAIFSGTLWWATTGMQRIAQMQNDQMVKAIRASEDAARASERSAESAVGVEIPRFAIRGIEFIGLEAIGIEAKLKHPAVVVVIKNLGRTPAFFEQEALCFRVGLTLPQTLKYDFAIDHPAGKTIESGESYRLERTVQLPSFSTQTISEIIQGTNSLWIYGYLFYYDFLDEPRWFNFRARYQTPPALDGRTFKGAWHSVRPSRRDDYGPELDEQAVGTPELERGADQQPPG